MQVHLQQQRNLFYCDEVIALAILKKIKLKEKKYSRSYATIAVQGLANLVIGYILSRGGRISHKDNWSLPAFSRALSTSA